MRKRDSSCAKGKWKRNTTGTALAHTATTCLLLLPARQPQTQFPVTTPTCKPSLSLSDQLSAPMFDGALAVSGDGFFFGGAGTDRDSVFAFGSDGANRFVAGGMILSDPGNKEKMLSIFSMRWRDSMGE